MHYFTLNNGIKIPALGLGTFGLENAQQCVEDALELGYRLIDTAQKYANEKDIGRALKVALNSGLKREEHFIQSKLWISHTDKKGALKAFDESLKNLGVDYLDCYMLHYPFNDLYAAYKELSKLYKKGLIKALGVSNFYPDKLADLCIFNEIKPCLNQLELHPFYQRKKELSFNHNLNIAVQAWCPLAQGKDIFTNKILSKIAKKHSKTVAQIILRWHIENKIIVIPKSTNKQRLRENIDIFDFSLDESDLSEISRLDTNKSLFLELFGYERIKWLEGFKSLASVNFNAVNALASKNIELNNTQSKGGGW